MFSFLRKELIRKANVRFCQTQFCIRSISNTSSANHHSFTTSYLVNSCGLSTENAISISKTISLATAAQPDSVITVLMTIGFTKTHISKTISKFPKLLFINTDKALKPKFLFFYSKGFTGLDLINALSRKPYVLGASLEETIIPSFNFLQSVVQTESNVITTLKKNIHVLAIDLEKSLAPKIAILRSHRVPEPNLVMFFKTEPEAFVNLSDSRFNEIVNEVMEMGFHPKQDGFLVALHQLKYLSDSKPIGMHHYTSRGWFNDEIKYTFGKHKRKQNRPINPLKVEAIRKYLENEIGYDAELVAKVPVLGCFGLENRVIPRFQVLQVLHEKGLLKRKPNPRGVLQLSEHRFRHKYVTKFEEVVYGLWDVYQGKDQRSKTLVLAYSENRRGEANSTFS